MTTEERFNEIRETFATANRALREVSGDRLLCFEPEDGPAGEVSVRVITKPPGVTQWTTPDGPEVVLTRYPSGEVTQQLTKLGYPVAVTDAQVATELGVDLEAWAAGRDAIEVGLATVTGVATPELSPHVVTDLDLYRAARTLSREDPGAALTLGVEGNDPSARRDRLAQAVAVRESWHAYADAEYTEAVAWSRVDQPDVPQPFGLGAVIRAEGDLEQALRDPEVRWQMAERLNLNGAFDWVHDEDGQREVYTPSRADTPEGRQEIGDELAQIANHLGVAAPGEPPSAAKASEEPHMSAALQERMSEAAQRVASPRPALMPPDVRPLRPEERSSTGPGRAAPGPGVPF